MHDQRTGFLLLHGWQNHRPEAHWQHRTATALRQRGLIVEYPQLPSADAPVVGEWSGAVLDALGRLDRSGRVDRVVVVAHSLSVLFWLGARPESPATVSRVLFVSPPSPAVAAGFAEIAAFASLPRAVSPLDEGRTTILASHGDPFNPEGALASYGEPLGIPTTMLNGQGHLDLDAGYGEWPSMLDWCLDPASTIRARD
jgi:predicted alpha/beta hydrolase family esterase